MVLPALSDRSRVVRSRTSSTSPGTQQSMSPSESSTSICRGTRPYELLSASYSLLPPGASWILTFCQSRVAE